ncbi:YbaY family lipoprotein [Pseudomonas silvicola]|uniref:YbaY family lipoprotein n=1 Tax=Pseudomonas sp. RIT-To-2 TaxID=3462541 RepID=UPI00227BB00E|nr:YbaY family lipoprotein [Pseudomonas silvicola]
MKQLTLVLLSALLGACSSFDGAPQASLDGEVFYLQRIALPPSATLSVSLQDVSLADAPAQVLASQNGPIKGQVPLPFQLRYDPRQVQPGHRYAVSARIESQGQLLFISTEQHTVQLDGKDAQPLRIRLNPVSQPTTAP